jgi:hypothetical protein
VKNILSITCFKEKMMKISKEKIYLSFFLIFLSLLSMPINVSASNIENQTWSFDFEDCTVSDALRQMARVMNIEILASRGGYEELNRSYQDQTVDYILRDIFRKESCAMIWRYGHNGLSSIDIWVFKGGGSKRGPGRQRLAQNDRAISIKGKVTKADKDSKPGLLREKSTDMPTRALFFSSSNSRRYPKASKRDVDAEKAVLSRTSSDDSLAPASTEDKVLDVEKNTLPPAPEKLHGLEPPPMPPGFSD